MLVCRPRESISGNSNKTTVKEISLGVYLPKAGGFPTSLSLYTIEIESNLEIYRLRIYGTVTRLHLAEIQYSDGRYRGCHEIY